MNEKIVNILVNVQITYEKKLSIYPHINHRELMCDFEQKNYWDIIKEKVVPLIAQYLEQHKEDNICNYTPYVYKQYKSEFMTLVVNWKKPELNSLEVKSKMIIKDFALNLLPNARKSENEKKEFLSLFVKKYEEDLKQICKNDTELFLYTVSQLCNPSIQYMILNLLHNDVTKRCRDFFESINILSFNKILNRLTFNTLDINMEDYCKKWIGKEKIYIKLLKKLLTEEKYEYSKTQMHSK